MGFIEIFIQIMPYLAVSFILGYIAKRQQKERESARKNRKRE